MIEDRRAGHSYAWIADKHGSTYEAVKQAFYRWRETGLLPAGSNDHKPRKPREPDSLAERIAALLGEIPLPPAPRTEIPDADLLRYTGRADVPQAALDALRAPLERFVLDWPVSEVPDT